MKKLSMAILLTVLSLFMLLGCNGNNTPTEEAAYDWTKDPKFAANIVPFDNAKYGSDNSYDKARVKPDPEGVKGTLSERIGYVENQWNISFIKDYISDPSLWETVTHRDSFKTWLSTYIPYPIRVRDNNESANGWGIEVTASSEKISEIEATLKNLVDQRIIWIAEHVPMVLPQFDNEETSNWRSAVNNFSSISSESPEFGDMKTIYGSPSWHLPYIGMDKLTAAGVNLKIDIGVGIIDSGLSFGHEDISKDISYIGGQSILDLNKVLHGSAVVGASSGSIIGNGIGVRGIVQAKTVFRDKIGADNYFETEKRIIDILNHPAKPRVVNISSGLGNDTYCEVKGNGKKFDKNKHFITVMDYRNLFATHPDVLFVIAAGNGGIVEPWDNAAVHYAFDDNSKTWVYRPLDNVIVVAANGPDNILHGYSDFGEGVDMSAPSGYMTISYFSGSHSYYNIEKNINANGISKYTPAFTGSGSTSAFVPGNSSSASYGTSFAAPLVTGAAALLFSADPLLTPKDVKEYLTINSMVGNKLRYAGEHWTGVAGNFKSEAIDKPLPILDVSASYDAVVANKKAIEIIKASTKDVQISIIDSNSIQDEYFNLVVNGTVIGKIENIKGGKTTYPVKLKSGDNLIELRITNTAISDTLLTIRIDPDGIQRVFQGDDTSYAWTINLP